MSSGLSLRGKVTPLTDRDGLRQATTDPSITTPDRTVRLVTSRLTQTGPVSPSTAPT